MFPRHRLVPALLCILALAPFATAHAQERGGGLGLELTAVAARTDTAGLDGGGDVAVDRYLVGAAASRPLSRRLRVGFEISHERSDYSFSGRNALGGPAPWGDIRRTGAAVPVFYALSQDLVLFASAMVSSSVESGVDWDDGLSWGGLAILNYAVSPELTLGIGAAAFRNIESTDAFPLITVEWRPSEDWWLGNPLPIGPVTPAGLELRWTGGERWTFAGGAAWRSERFRLDDEGVLPGGVGEVTGLPVFLRASRRLGEGFRLHVVGGVSVLGELTLEDDRGRGVASVDRDSAPFLAAGIQGRF